MLDPATRSCVEDGLHVENAHVARGGGGMQGMEEGGASGGRNIHMTFEIEMAIVKIPIRKGGMRKQWGSIL